MQVTLLGLTSILMGTNDGLKHEAVAALEAGSLMAFGVSEKQHGSDLFGNEFIIRSAGPGRFVANGSKYYIGNANCATIISILARKDDEASSEREKRSPFALMALRPDTAKALGNVQKIHTLGVRAGYVGSFDVKDHEFPESDLAAQGREAWDAVIGAVTLGKFFLGFGSIGICEHAMAETVAHVKSRVLYGKQVIAMPHIRTAVAAAATRLTAMKLYAYRALDYFHAASPLDRRYMLYSAVQKAKVSTEGVKVMSRLSECIGAKGFGQDTFFEMALRDAQLIPLLESSAHINLAFTAQFVGRYFDRPDPAMRPPPCLATSEVASAENEYLYHGRTNAINSIGFPPHSAAYERLLAVANVRLFAGQIEAFRQFLQSIQWKRDFAAGVTIDLGHCLATIAYGQLIAEAVTRFSVPAPMVSAIFQLLVMDLNSCALVLAAIPAHLVSQMVAVPETAESDWAFVGELIGS